MQESKTKSISFVLGFIGIFFLFPAIGGNPVTPEQTQFQIGTGVASLLCFAAAGFIEYRDRRQK